MMSIFCSPPDKVPAFCENLRFMLAFANGLHGHPRFRATYFCIFVR